MYFGSSPCSLAAGEPMSPAVAVKGCSCAGRGNPTRCVRLVGRGRRAVAGPVSRAVRDRPPGRTPGRRAGGGPGYGGALSMPPRVPIEEGLTLTVEEGKRLLDGVADHRMGVLVLLASSSSCVAAKLSGSCGTPSTWTLVPSESPTPQAAQEPRPEHRCQDSHHDQRTQDQTPHPESSA